jgi:2-dehydro-3-deoxyphosphooctonate aldolase (KDO 8-P synthase)
MQTMRVGDISIGPDQPLTVIAGPCVAESLQMCVDIATSLRDMCAKLGLPFIFKASYDKANRSSIDSPRGPGMEQALEWFAKVRDKVGVPTTTDIHEPQHAEQAAKAVDLLQIPAFLCRQTDLLVAAAKTGVPVNVKKGQFMSPAEMTNVVSKLTEGKAAGIMLTERGTFFGYNRLVNDFVGLGDLMDLGHPVCFDVTHSTQQPGGATGGRMSGGRPDRAPLLARSAVAAGVQAIFIETHPDPQAALSDAATMLPLHITEQLLGELKAIHDVVVARAKG